MNGPQALAAAGLVVSRESLERLTVFAALLKDWQRVKNLVGPSALDELWTRHIADSIQLAELAPLEGSWADLGSGAGFPGLVVGILMAERASAGRVHLIESNGRKAAFLREAARLTGARVVVHDKRAELVLPSLGDIGVVTARAFAPLVRLLEYAQPLVEKGAVALFPKGQDVEAELTEASIYWKFEVERFPSRTNLEAAVLRVRNIARRP